MLRIEDIPLPFLSIQERETLISWYDDFEIDLGIMPHEISNATGITIQKILLFLSILSVKDLIEMYLLVYHHCDLEVPIGSKKFGEGFPILPFDCSLCDEEITNEYELEFDYLVKKSKEN